MNTTISPSPDFVEHLKRLGLHTPTLVTVLPTNLSTASSIQDLTLESAAATVKTLFRSAGIDLQNIYPQDHKPQYIKNNAADWIAPAIFIGAGILSEHANTVSVALNVLSNYLTDLFKGKPAQPTIKASFVVETDALGTYKRVEYEGSAEGLRALGEVITKVHRGK
jgi:hypothetical protein